MAKTKRRSLKTAKVSPETTTSTQTKGSKRNSADDSSLNVPNVSRRSGKVVKPRQRNYVMKYGERYVKTTMTKQLFREITALQRSTQFLIPRTNFIRLVREIIMEYYPNCNYNLGHHAAEALQEAAESYLVIFLQESYMCASHARRMTLKDKDMKLLKLLRNDPYLSW